MENKSSLEIVEICLWENGGITLAADHSTDQHSEGCCRSRTRGSQPNPVPWWNGIGASYVPWQQPGPRQPSRAWQSPRASPPGRHGEDRGDAGRAGDGLWEAKQAPIHLVPLDPAQAAPRGTAG